MNRKTALLLLASLLPNASLAATPDEIVTSTGEVVEPVTAIEREFEPSSEGTGRVVSFEKLQGEVSLDEFGKLLDLPPLSAQPPIETIIDPDGRTRVPSTQAFPNRAIVLLTNSAGRCTGWMAGPDLVLTAGHCVHSGKGGTWYTNVRVYPGRDGADAPFGSCGARTLYSVTGWTTNSSEQYDYGGVKLDCKIGNTVGWLGYFATTENLVGKPTELPGYPGDKPLTQWTHADQVRAADPFQLFYQNDTMPGNSGGAVYYNRPGCGVCAMSFHAYGRHGGGNHAPNNHGTRITRERFANIQAWRNAP